MGDLTTRPAHDQHIADQLTAGSSKRDVVESLVANGMDREAAWRDVRRVDETLPHHVEPSFLGMEGAHTYDAASDSNGKRLLVGAASILVGLGITGCSYLVAAPGGAYFVVWVPIVWGAWHVVAALFSMAIGR